MKQVKILKRPSPTPSVPTKPTERVASEISSLLETTLTRERARLEAMYRSRQEALLRAISNVLNENLEKAVAQAAKREMDALVAAMAKLNADVLADSTTNKKISTDQSTEEMRAAFAAAFERVSVPAFESAISEMLRNLATMVDSQIDQNIIKPTNNVATSVENAADTLRSAKTSLADISADISVDTDSRDDALIQQAIDSGDMRTALQLAVDKSPKIKEKAVTAVLDASVGPEDAFSGDVPSMTELVDFAVLLATELSDRTESRLAWLYEILTLMDDAQFNRHDLEAVERTRTKMQATIETLSAFYKDGAPGPAEAKHTKLLIRVFKAHLNAL